MTNAELAVLGLVVEQPRHGYQIEQVIEERGMRRWTEIGFSSIYFLLKKLERQKLIKGRWEKTGSGPERWTKVYRSTDAGLEAFHVAIAETLSVPHPIPHPLMLGLANINAISTEEVLTALSRYGKHLEEKIETLRTVRQDNRHSHPYFVDAMFELSLAVMQVEREWVKKFTKQLQLKSQQKQEQKV
jgi:DNA-binding PadR family transcriptional regulator